MNKEELIEVFNDTIEICKSPQIEKRVKHTIGHTYICNYDNNFMLNEKCFSKTNMYEKPAVIKVTNRDTLSAAKEYYNIAGKMDDSGLIGILNFASSTNPGGGVTKGSTAQEECLCRCSTLYPALNQKKCFDMYYNVNRKNNTNLGSDTIIYSEDVLVLKDKDYNTLTKDDMFYVDVITCAAPNLRENPKNQYNDGASNTKLTLSDEELYAIHVTRARNILNVAVNNDIEYLVLGAFGCGAFKNKPEIVAKAYKDVLKDYMHFFGVIDFAIIGNNDNYEIFKKIILS